VTDVWVVNASPIIALAKVGQLDLLERLATQVLVPEPVVSEVLAGPADDPAHQALERGWGTRVRPGPIPVAIVEWGLGSGESSVLAVALERQSCTAVLDDASGRMCARALGVPLIGTLGVVLRAKRRGLIASASEVATALRDSGLRLDDRMVEAALLSVGENWRGK